MRISPLAAAVRRHLLAHAVTRALDPAAAWLASSPVGDDDRIAADLTGERLASLTVNYEATWLHATGLEWHGDAGFRRIGKILEEVGVYEYEHGRAHLTSCCVRARHGSPGAGFTGLLNRLPGQKHVAEQEEDRVWRRELLRTIRFWQSAAPPGTASLTAGIPVLHHDPTAIADAHYSRLADRLRRIS
jgi:hypothetical protein